MSPTASRIYVGIDPSLRSTGMATLTEPDVTETRVSRIEPKKLKGVERLAFIRDYIRGAIEEPPAFACIEGPSIYSVNRADDIGQLRGVILILLHDLKVPTIVIAPKTLKKFATGNGDASKERMVKAAQKEFDYSFLDSDDIADALWLARIAWRLHDDSGATRKQLEVIDGIRNPKIKRNVGSSRALNI